MMVAALCASAVSRARALGAKAWMAHLTRDHPEMKCTQIPGKPVIIGGDGGGVGKPLETFLKDSKAVTFGPTDDEGNSLAERASGLDDIIVDIMAWSRRVVYEPDDMPTSLQVDVARHLCDMFARQEKWLHPSLTTNGIDHDDEIGRWGWKDPLAMYLIPIFRDVYGPSVTYVHLVRDPRTLPLGNLHEKERDLQQAYFGEERWHDLTMKFEEEWMHLSEHASLKDVEKDDVIDLLRTTAYWTAINFEIGALFKGPLADYGMILRAEDLVQPDMEHFRRGADGVKLEKYQAAQKVVSELSMKLKLPAKISNEFGSHQHVMHNLKRFTIYREKFTYRPNSPLVDVQTRIAEKTLTLFGYSTDKTLFVPQPRHATTHHGHRVTPKGEHMHEEHRYTPENFDGDVGEAEDDENAHPENTDHMLGTQLKSTDRLRQHREKEIPPDTEDHKRIKAQLMEARRKNFMLETTKIGGKSLKDVIDHL